MMHKQFQKEHAYNLLITYSYDLSGKFLPFIQDEIDGIKRIWDKTSLNENLSVNSFHIKTHEDMWDAFSSSHNPITIFHYCGHSDQKHLILDSKKHEQIKIAEFIHFLSHQSSLDLVFLNACITNSKEFILSESKVPNLILSNRNIKDYEAASFAKEFYRGLAANLSIYEAFEEAKAKYQSISRGFDLVKEDVSDNFPWELYTNPEANSADKLKSKGSSSLLRVCAVIFILSVLSASIMYFPYFQKREKIREDSSKSNLSHTAKVERQESKKPIKEATPQYINKEISIVDSLSLLGINALKVKVRVEAYTSVIYSSENGVIEFKLPPNTFGKRIHISVSDPLQRYRGKEEYRKILTTSIPNIELTRINQSHE